MKTLNKYSVEDCTKLVETDLLRIESEIDGLSNVVLANLTSSGESLISLKRSLQEGDKVLLSDFPEIPFVVKKGEVLSRNPQAASNSADAIWNNLTIRFSCLNKGVSGTSSANVSGAGTGIDTGTGAGTDADIGTDSEEFVFSSNKPEPPKKDPKNVRRKITIEDARSSYLKNHFNVYNKLPMDVASSDGKIIEECKISCRSSTIQDLPEDFELLCHINPDEGKSSEVSHQPFGTENSVILHAPNVKLDSSNTKASPDDSCVLDIRLAKEHFGGAIVIPSLTCPVLVKQSQEAPIRLLLALPEEFKKILDIDPAKKEEDGVTLGGKNTTIAILQHLAVFDMVEQIAPNDTKPLFATYVDGFEYVQVRLLDKLDAWFNNRTFVCNGDGEPWCVIRGSSSKTLKKAKLIYLVEVSISAKGLSKSNLPKEGLYDIAWQSLTEEGKEHYKDHDIKTRKVKGLDVDPFFNEPQDVLQKVWLDSIENGKKGRYQLDDIKNISRERLRHPDKEGAGFASTNENPIIQRHPIYISSKKYLNPGQVSDVHVSSRQNVFLRSKAQVIPGASLEDSPYIGDMVNNNFLALKNLMDQMGDNGDIDLVVITGDLIDHCVNLDPEKSKARNTGGIWKDVHSDNFKKPELYPKYIDDTAVYGLFEYFMIEYKKPIILVSGNHEAYGVPYGISPRKPLIGKVNAGIPADHNLTIYEACLMYGEDYGVVVKNFNFDDDNFSWFYQVFSPVSDMLIPYDKQQFLGLEWGDDEAFIFPTLSKGGSLPRSTESCNNEQLKLIRQGAENKDGINILLSHFTFVNYGTDIPVKKPMVLDIDDVRRNDPTPISGDEREALKRKKQIERPDLTHSDEGSFYRNRQEVYSKHILTGDYKYCLAGHSHRAGFYYIKNVKSRDKWDVVGVVPGDVQPGGFKKEAGFDPNGARLVVSGSSGPISKQNFNGELAGQGMSPPQGIWVDVANDTIKLVKCSLKESKPRLAVVAEYIERVAGQRIFEKFTISKKDPDETELVFHEEFPKSIVKEIRLHKVDSNFRYLGATTMAFLSDGLVDSDDVAYFLLKTARMDSGKGSSYYLSIHFDEKKDSKNKLIDYDFETPCCLPIKLQDSANSFKIQLGAEVPHKSFYKNVSSKNSRVNSEYS